MATRFVNALQTAGEYRGLRPTGLAERVCGKKTSYNWMAKNSCGSVKIALAFSLRRQ